MKPKNPHPNHNQQEFVKIGTSVTLMRHSGPSIPQTEEITEKYEANKIRKSIKPTHPRQTSHKYTQKMQQLQWTPSQIFKKHPPRKSTVSSGKKSMKLQDHNQPKKSIKQQENKTNEQPSSRVPKNVSDCEMTTRNVFFAKRNSKQKIFETPSPTPNTPQNILLWDKSTKQEESAIIASCPPRPASLKPKISAATSFAPKDLTSKFKIWRQEAAHPPDQSAEESNFIMASKNSDWITP